MRTALGLTTSSSLGSSSNNAADGWKGSGSGGNRGGIRVDARSCGDAAAAAAADYDDDNDVVEGLGDWSSRARQNRPFSSPSSSLLRRGRRGGGQGWRKQWELHPPAPPPLRPSVHSDRLRDRRKKMREESNQTKSPKASVNSSSFLNDETYGSDATALARRKNCPKVSLSPSSSFSSTPSSLSSMPSTSCDANNASLNSASNSHSSRCSSSSSSSGSSSNREGCSKNDISTINELSTGAQPLSVQQTLSEMLPMSTTTTTTTTTTTGAAAAATTTAAETAEAETAAAVTTKATLKRDKQPQRQQQQRSSWRPLANVSCLAHCDPDLLNNRTFMQSLIARVSNHPRWAVVQSVCGISCLVLSGLLPFLQSTLL